MRILRRLFLIGLLVLLALGFAASMFFDRGARIDVEQGISYALAVPGTAGSVKIRPFSGSVGLEDLSIANPEGFSANPLLDLKQASMSVKMTSLMSDEVDVPNLRLSGVHLRLEGRGSQTNYGVILENLARFDRAEKQDGKASKAGQGTGKRFLIRDLTIRDATVEADYALDSASGKLGKTAAAVTLPEIHIKDLGNGKSLTLAELSMKIFQALLQAACSGNIPGLSGDISKDLQKNLSGLGDKAADLGKDVEGALKGLKGLLEKKD